MLKIRVTSTNAKPIKESYDGIPYVFEKDKTTVVPYEAACHIFGVEFPEAGKDVYESNEPGSLRSQIFKHLQKRWGWNHPAEDVQRKANQVFAALKFSPVQLVTVEKTYEEDIIAAPRSNDGTPPVDSTPPFISSGNEKAEDKSERGFKHRAKEEAA